MDSLKKKMKGIFKSETLQKLLEDSVQGTLLSEDLQAELDDKSLWEYKIYEAWVQYPKGPGFNIAPLYIFMQANAP